MNQFLAMLLQLHSFFKLLEFYSGVKLRINSTWLEYSTVLNLTVELREFLQCFITPEASCTHFITSFHCNCINLRVLKDIFEIIDMMFMLNMRRYIFITILLIILIVSTYPLLKTIHRSYSKLILTMNSEKITIQPITSFTGKVRIINYIIYIYDIDLSIN